MEKELKEEGIIIFLNNCFRIWILLLILNELLQINLEILYITDSVYWIWILHAPSLVNTHISKSKIFVQIFHFDFIIFSGNKSCQQLKIPNIFTSFSIKFFLTIFLVKSKLSTAKKSKTAAFSRVFTQNSKTIFLGKSKLNFWTKMKISNSVCELISKHGFFLQL